MFRLADLYLDVADEEVELRLAAQEKMLRDQLASGVTPGAGSGSGSGGQDSAAIVADYSKSLDLWQQILTKFPNYRQTPSTLYLLAYYGKTKDERRSLQVFLALSCANKYKWDGAPPPVPTRAEAIKRVEAKTLRDPYADCQAYPGAETELVRHAWVRGIADYHFTVPGELDEAIAAYLKVADTGQDSRLFAEALYKLAWSYYKRDLLFDSIKRFDQSVKLYDSVSRAAANRPSSCATSRSSTSRSRSPIRGRVKPTPIRARRSSARALLQRPRERAARTRRLGRARQGVRGAPGVGSGGRCVSHRDRPAVGARSARPRRPSGDRQRLRGRRATSTPPIKPRPISRPSTHPAPRGTRPTSTTAMRWKRSAGSPSARCTRPRSTRKTAAKNLRTDYESTTKKDPQAKADYLAMYAKSAELYRSVRSQYSGLGLHLRVQLPARRDAVLRRALPGGGAQYKWVRDHRDIGTAYYIDAARTILLSHETEMRAEVAAGKLQPLKIPTVADLPALPQPCSRSRSRTSASICSRVRQLSVARARSGGRAAAGHQRRADQPRVLARRRRAQALRQGRSISFCHTPPADPRTRNRAAPAAKAKDGSSRSNEATEQPRRDRSDQQGVHPARLWRQDRRSISRSARTAR